MTTGQLIAITVIGGFAIAGATIVLCHAAVFAWDWIVYGMRPAWWVRLTETEAMTTPLKWPKGLWKRITRTAGSVRTDAPCGSTMKIPPGWSYYQMPILPEPFAALLDIDALEREAGEARQGGREQPKGLRQPKGMRQFLKPDVTRTEELILTAALWRIGAVCVDCRELPRANGQEAAGSFLRLCLTGRGMYVD